MEASVQIPAMPHGTQGDGERFLTFQPQFLYRLYFIDLQWNLRETVSCLAQQIGIEAGSYEFEIPSPNMNSPSSLGRQSFSALVS